MRRLSFRFATSGNGQRRFVIIDLLDGSRGISHNCDSCQTACTKRVMNKVCAESKSNPIADHSKKLCSALRDLQTMRLTECLHLGCGHKNGNIGIFLRARSEALVGHNIKKNGVKSLSRIESELNANLVRRRPILVGLSFV